MERLLEFYIRCILLGIGLAMDACAVSMANGLKYPNMKKSYCIKMCITFGLAQGLMPFFGYSIGHAMLSYIEKYIPWIALVLLLSLGVNMILGIFQKDGDSKSLTKNGIFIQAIATSLDALTIGFSISNYTVLEAVQFVGIVTIITILMCYLGIKIGKKFGTRLGYVAEIIGGLILIGIGIEIFLKGM